MKLRIRAKESTYVALEASKRDPIRLEAGGDAVPADRAPVPQAPVAAPTDGRKSPPRLRKPSPQHDRCLAPTGDLESHREPFGNTLSDDFVRSCSASRWSSPPNILGAMK
jgi:hypothetical protein